MPARWPCDWCQATPAEEVTIEPAVYSGGKLLRRAIIGYACTDHQHLTAGPAEPLPANNIRRRKDRSAVQLELDVDD
jgi:hypothetical protein